MTESKLQQPYLECHPGHEIRLPMAVSTGKPTPWPKGDPVPVQNFCCECGEARRYSEAEVHFRDVTLTPTERQSLYSLKVVRLSTPCEHIPCKGSVEIFYVVDVGKVGNGQLQVPSTTYFEGLPCTAPSRHENNSANRLGLFTRPVVDEKWEKIQSLCKAQEW